MTEMMAQMEGNISQVRNLKLLAYVHLRNIHGSTGAGRVARQMVEHLARRNDVDLRVLADAGDHRQVIPLVNEPWNGFHYHLFKAETSRQQARWFLIDSPRAESYWQDAEIVYCTAESYVPTRKAKLVATLHDAAYLETDAHIRDRSFHQQSLRWRLLYAKLLRRADMFHTVSQFSADRLSHFYPEMRARLRVVRNAATPHFFRPPTESGLAYVKSVGLSNKPFVLVPGGLHFRKNADLILATWPSLLQLHPDITLAVVNHSNAHYVAKAQAIGSSVCILGFVPDDGLRALYSAAQVVWFPSRYEGFGLPVVEAMACGACVLASDASSIPEVVGEAALLASPTKPADHIDALDTLLSNGTLRHQFGQRGAIRVSQFTWTRAAAELKTCFDELL